MAWNRHWYDDVADMALRATLKELGFKRKTHATYVCNHSPDRVWVFENHMGTRGGPTFNVLSGIHVPAIAEILGSLAPEFDWVPTYTRTPTHLAASIGELVKIEQGWDRLTWDKNPKSRSRSWRYIYPPYASKIGRILKGYTVDSGWNPQHVEATLSRFRKFWYSLPKQARKVRGDGASPYYYMATLWLGPELDALWRKYTLDWLQRCDDPVYLAEWLDKYVLPERPALMSYGPYAVTAAAAYILAGNNQRAGEILNEVIARIGDPPEGNCTNEFERATDDALRIVTEAAHALADEFGIRL